MGDVEKAIIRWIRENYGDSRGGGLDFSIDQIFGLSNGSYIEITLVFGETSFEISVMRVVGVSEGLEYANPAMFDQLAKCLDESGVVRKPPPTAPESPP